MKYFMLLTCIFLHINILAASDQKKDERKALIDTIKKNYDSWLFKSSPENDPMTDHDARHVDADVFFTSADKHENLASGSGAKTNSLANPEKHIFGDFNFKISGTQAVVKFSVDTRFVSAFLEKKNGQWELVCAADISPDL
jgi:hypothetical protein